jgi:hypothetical protein
MASPNWQQFKIGAIFGIIGCLLVGLVAFIIGQQSIAIFLGGLATGLYFVGMNNVVGSFVKRDVELQNKIDKLQVTLENCIQKSPESENIIHNNEPKISPLTAEEIAGKTLAYHAFQTSCILAIAFAAFIYASEHYDGLTSILAGCFVGISFGLIALGTIRRLGFKTDPEWTHVSFRTVILVVLLLLVIIGYFALSYSSQHLSSVTGNVTYVYENCNYSISNIVNNYSVSINSVTIEKRDSMVSIKELTDLMQKTPNRL